MSFTTREVQRKELIDDTSRKTKQRDIKRVLLCSGKYFELAEQRKRQREQAGCANHSV